jgi:hypothetical protein
VFSPETRAPLNEKNLSVIRHPKKEGDDREDGSTKNEEPSAYRNVNKPLPDTPIHHRIAPPFASLALVGIGVVTLKRPTTKPLGGVSDETVT